MTSEPPSSAFPPEQPTHRAPMRDQRPRSAWAIWTLVITIVFGIGALVTFSGAAVIPAVILGVVALVKIKPQLMRGQVMVIISLVMAALVGSCSFMLAKTTHDIVEHVGAGVLGALGSDEQDRVDKWLAPDAREAGAADLFRERFAAVVEALGPYQGELVLPSKWLGGVAIVAPPTDIEELGQGIGEAWTLRPGVFWCRGRFRDGLVHVELYFGPTAQEGLAKAAEHAQEQVPSPVLQDLRFFRDK